MGEMVSRMVRSSPVPNHAYPSSPPWAPSRTPSTATIIAHKNPEWATTAIRSSLRAHSQSANAPARCARLRQLSRVWPSPQ
eukprot:scaffold127138_cov31-Tisochrysis_lutea.AAC.2